MNQKRLTVSVLSMFICMPTEMTLAAEGYTGIHPAMSSALKLGGGAFFSTYDYKLEFEADGDGGTSVDPGDLGADEEETVGFGFLRWRFSDRWRLEGDYFSLSDSGARKITERIAWGNLDFEIGAETKLKLDVDVFRAAVGYSLVKTDLVEIGGGLGVHHIDFSSELSGKATVNGFPFNLASETASLDGIAPNVALFGGYAFNEQWYLSGRFDWISADVGKLSGSLLRVGASVIYQPFKHVGLGVGYDYFNVDVEFKRGGEKTKVDGDVHGPTLFLSLSFF